MFKKVTQTKCLTALFFMLFAFTANAQVQSSFSVNQIQQCLNGNSFVFTNTSSSGAGITYSWNFGDGTTTAVANPTKSYAAAGYYSVQLIADSGGIHHYSNKTIIVSPLPVASFYYIGSTSTGGSYTFISTSTIANGVMNYFWDFGDGTTSTLISPTHNFTAIGSYNVKLLVTSDAGCKDSVSNAVAVTVTSLNSAFAVGNTYQCLAGNNFSFTNSSSSGGGISYLWNFGDGITSVLANPTHSYATAGTYNVTLTVSAAGATNAFSSQTITVGNPTASFSISGSGTVFSFASTSSNAVSYAWTLGDGTTSNASSISNKTYPVGAYNVKLVVTSSGGCKDSVTRAIVSAPYSGNPVPSFTVNTAQQCLNGNSFSFTNTSTVAGGTTYLWIFGDGTSVGSTNATHTYATAGYYNVQLKATYGGNDFYTNQQVIVKPQPVASFTSSANATPLYSVSFNNTSTLSSGNMTFVWNFGDGGSTSTISNPQHTYATLGTFNAKLVVTSDGGCKDSVTNLVADTVAPGGTGGSVIYPTLGFIVNGAQQCLVGNNFSFINSSVSPSGTIYQWIFGDGITANTTNATHTYATAGYYNVQLKATYNGNDYYTNSQMIVKPTPVALFTFAVDTNIANTFRFYNTSTLSSGNMSFAWDFGDGTGTSVISNPSHTYATAGPYTAKLVITSDGGCKDSLSQPVVILPAPTTAFTVTSATTQCANGSLFTFSNTSTSGVGVYYSWNFGDGTSSTLANPTKTYSTAGTFTITLTTTTSGGSTSATRIVTVNPKPSVAFTSAVAGNIATFTNGSSISTGTLTYYWDLSGGFDAVTTNATKTYADGSYTIKLIATSNVGCVDSVSHTISVGALPTAAFTVSSATTQCSNSDLFTFNNTSSSGAGITYRWNFGDGTTDSVSSPTKSYTGAGTFTVILTVTNANGSTTTSQNVVVLAGPTVSIATYPNANSGGSYTFISNSSVPAGTMTYYWNLGDGTLIDSTVNVTHTYAAPGTYTVKLIVVGSGGCSDSSSTTVTFCPKVTAGFNATGLTSQCLTGNSFTFANTSTNNAGIPAASMSYVWSFGDSTFSSLQNPPAHTYAAWGDYDVKLVVTLTSGSCVIKDSITKLKVVSVNPMPVASYRLILDNFYTPTALLSDTTKRCWHPGYDFSYQSSSTLGRGTMDYFWHFGTSALFFRDGDSSHYINPRIVFDTAGIYPVKLVVFSDKGCKDSVTRIVHLSDPRARFNFTIDSTTNVYAVPVVSVTDHSYDYGGYLVGWNWNFGSNATPATSNVQNPASFTYTCGGAKSVVLTVTSNVGCTADTTRNFVIRIKPHAGFSISAPNYTPNIYARPTFTFTNGTTVNDACPAMSYAWNFGDGGTSTSTSPTHIFKGSGTYTVTLIATNGNGGKKDTTTQNVTVSIRPRAIFSTSQTVTPNVYAAPTVAYNNTTSSQDTAAPAASLTYSWNFGDLSTSNVRFPATHQYAAGGTYVVTLIVTNPVSGLSDTVSHNVVVNVKPQAAFTTGAAVYSPDVYAQPNYTFTDGTTANDVGASFTYAWSFGDLGTSIAASPNHTYTSGGTYTVTLITTNTNGGLKDTVSHNVVVKIKPQAAFTTGAAVYSPNVYAQPNYTFTNTTSVADGAASMTYAWDFGDGNTSIGTSPNHTYTSGGTYTVTLIATNANGGLSDTTTSTVTAKIKPQAAFTSNVDYGGDIYSNPNVDFTNGTTSNDGAGVYTYSWDFGDGSALSTAINPSHQYAAGGTYTVTLTATNTNGGLTDVVSHNVVVVITPRAVLSVHSSIVSTPIPMGIGNADYKVYTITGLSNGANPSTVVTGSIASTEITIDTVYIPRADSAQYAQVTNADATFGIQNDTLANYRFNVRLIVTSNLGVTDTAYAVLGATETGFTAYRGVANPGRITVQLPNIGANGRAVVNTPIVSAKLQGLLVYPNPGKELITVSFAAPEKATSVTVRIYNLNGRMVMQQKKVVESNIATRQNVQLNVSNISSGVYNINVVDDKGANIGNAKFVKASE